MTQAQVIALIQQWIVQNHNELITADVLRPILEAMVNQPNDKIGDLNDLATIDKSTIVAAINEINSQLSNTGIQILTGTTDPNITPPLGVQLGDFYLRNNGDFYQYNGTSFIQVKDPTPQTYIVPISLLGVNLNRPEPEWVKDAVEIHINNYGAIQAPKGSIITFMFNSISSTTLNNPTLSRVFYRLTSGASSVSAINNEYTDIMPDGRDSYTIANDFLISLGDIGSDEVEDAFNADINQPFAMDNDMFIEAIQNGQYKLWQWRGGVGTFGSTATPATANDFLDISGQPSIPQDDIFYDYDNIADLLNGQLSQQDQAIYFVKDASADTNLDFQTGETRTYAYYQLRSNSTKTGSLSDYRLISAPWANGGSGGASQEDQLELIQEYATIGTEIGDTQKDYNEKNQAIIAALIENVTTGLYTIPQSGTDIGKLDLSNPLGLDATTNINEVESLSIHTGSVVGGNITFRSRTTLRPTIAGATEQVYLSEPSANFDNTATYTIVVWREANKINWLMRKRS